MHLPYTEACSAHVVVAWTASLFKGFVLVVAVNVIIQSSQHSHHSFTSTPIANPWIRFGPWAPLDTHSCSGYVDMLNILLLIACICITIASFLYFFYFNRLIAWFIGLVIRLVYWNDGASSIWLEIGVCSRLLLNSLVLISLAQDLFISPSLVEGYSSRMYATIQVIKPPRLSKAKLPGGIGYGDQRLKRK